MDRGELGAHHVLGWKYSGGRRNGWSLRTRVYMCKFNGPWKEVRDLTNLPEVGPKLVTEGRKS